MKTLLSGILNSIFRGTMSVRDRRKYIRLEKHYLLKYKVLDKAAEMSFVRNISATGVLFYCKKQLRRGDMVELQINFPGYPKPVKGVAEVMRVNALKKMGGFEIGVQFVNVDEDAKKFIEKKTQPADKKKGKRKKQ